MRFATRKELDYAVRHHEYYGIISYKAPLLKDLEEEIRFNPSLTWPEQHAGFKEVAVEEFEKNIHKFVGLPILYDHIDEDVYPMGLTTKAELLGNGTMAVYFQAFDNFCGRALAQMVEFGGPHGLSLQHLHNFETVQPREVSVCYVGKRPKTGVVAVVQHGEPLPSLPLDKFVLYQHPEPIVCSSLPLRQAFLSTSMDKVSAFIAQYKASADPTKQLLASELEAAVKPDAKQLKTSFIDALGQAPTDLKDLPAYTEKIKTVAQPAYERLEDMETALVEKASKPNPAYLSSAKQLLEMAGKSSPAGEIPAPVKELASQLSSNGTELISKATANEFLAWVNTALAGKPAAVQEKASADSKKRKSEFVEEKPAKKDSSKFWES